MPRTGVYTVQLVEFEHEGKPRSYSTYTKQFFLLPAVQSTVHGYGTWQQIDSTSSHMIRADNHGDLLRTPLLSRAS